MRHTALLISAFAAVVAGGNTAAQNYPAKPVRLIAPFPAGGGTDILARTIARKLGEEIGRAHV